MIAALGRPRRTRIDRPVPTAGVPPPAGRGRNVAHRLAGLLVTALCLASAAASLAAPCPSGRAAASPPVPAASEPLPPAGAEVERPIAAGEVHVFTVDLAPGDFLRAVVEQQGIDLVLHLDAGGERLLTGDSPNGAHGPEPLSWIATAAGEHRLAIVAGGSEGRGGYRLRVEAVRPAEPRDRLLVEAERAEYRALVAHLVEGTAESRHRAVGDYETALARWRELGDERRQAAVLSHLTSLQLSLGDSETAMARAEESLALWRKLGEPVLAAQQANSLGIALKRAGRTAEAITFYQRAREELHAAGLAADEGVAVCNLAGLHDRTGDGELARRLFEEGLELIRSGGGLAHQEIGCLVGLGRLEDRQGDWERALSRYRQALSLAEASGDDRDLPAVLNNIGAVYQRQGRYHEALELYQRVLEIDVARGFLPGEATARNNIGSVLAMLGRRGDAEGHYRRARELYREARDPLAEARALSNLGHNALLDGRPEDAVEPLAAAAALAEELGNRPLSTELAIDFAELALTRDDPSGAAAHAARAAALARETGFLPHQAAALQQMGRAARAAGDLATAERRLGEALAIWRRTGRRLSQADALHRLADLARARDDLTVARERLEASLELIEDLRRMVVVDELRSSFFAVRHRVFEAHVDLLMELELRRPGEGWAERALAASEAGRARNLLDLLDRAEVDLAAGAPPELVAREAEARHRLNVLERRRLELAAGGEAGEELDDVAAAIAETRWQASWLEAQVLRASPRAGDLLTATPPSAEEVRRHLGRDDLLIEVALGEVRSFLWAVDAGGVEAFVLPGRAELEALARTAYRGLADSGADAAADAALAELSRRLLAPIAGRLPGRRLLVVPDGALHYLPFAVLAAPPSLGDEPRPLVVDHEIVQLPSAAVLVHFSRAPPPAPRARTLAVFADPVFDTSDGRLGDAAATLRGGGPGIELRRLRFSRLEAEGLAALVAPEERLIALDLDASRETLLATDLSAFRFLHFATHGVLDQEIPELSGLVLSLVDERGTPRDGFLRLHDIYRLDLDADLVTLSACRTALGRELRGEGLVGLTRGFFHAGARGVVASLWDVQDRATARLMESFYAGMLREGLPPAAALRAAQAELRRDPRWRDPYYWAGFVLQAAPDASSSPGSERSGDRISIDAT